MPTVDFDFDQAFDEDCLYFYGPRLEDAADGDTDAIWRLLALEPRMDVLDLACGHGRIANRLAALGARVTGVDATPSFLEHANAQARAHGVTVDFVQGDMRSLPFADQRFDRVLSWFTSFGYFDDEENRQVLAETHRVLRPRGRLLIESNNLAELLPRWLPVVVNERDGAFAIDRHVFDPSSARGLTERTIIRNGRTRQFSFSVRMFIAAELRDWLLAAGFSAVEFFDHSGEPLTAQSPRMVTIAVHR
jgi:SAM-dependent methyltransferase